MEIGFEQKPLDVFVTKHGQNELQSRKEKNKIFDRHHFSHSVVPVIQRNKLIMWMNFEFKKQEFHVD